MIATVNGLSHRENIGLYSMMSESAEKDGTMYTRLYGEETMWKMTRSHKNVDTSSHYLLEFPWKRLGEISTGYSIRDQTSGAQINLFGTILRSFLELLYPISKPLTTYIYGENVLTTTYWICSEPIQTMVSTTMKNWKSLCSSSTSCSLKDELSSCWLVTGTAWIDH